jgi:cytochrome P450
VEQAGSTRRRAQVRADALRPPGPHDRLPGATFLAFRRDALDLLLRTARRYGDIAYYRLGGIQLYLLTHPEQVKDVLVTHHRRFTGLAFEAGKSITGEGLLSAQGETHRRHRRILQPAFHRDWIASYARVMVERARQWGEQRRNGEVVALRSAMASLTLGVIGETMFGTEDESAAGEIREFLDAAVARFTPLTFSLARLLERLPLPASRRFIQARSRLDDRVYGLITSRRAIGDERTDLLSLLLAAQDSDGDRGGLTDREIRDEVVTIFLAGHETTANAVTWAWCLLADHPESQREMHRELTERLGDRLPTADDLAALPFTSGVFAETLRLRPTVPMIFRRVVEPLELGGYLLPRGAVVILSQYVTHRDPRFYEEPERFDPRRWLAGSAAARPRFAFFPFGGGPRVCIGEHFAWLEGVMLLATIAQRWRIVPVDAGPTPAPAPGLLTRPPETLRMRMEARRGDAPHDRGFGGVPGRLPPHLEEL